MLYSRRSLIASAAALTGAAAAGQALADAPAPMVVYDDELKNGWSNWSWAKVEMSVPTGSVKPMRVQGDPWTALALHHDAFALAGYSKLTFFINGGVDGGQSLAVKLLNGGKAIESNFVIQLTAKAWKPASVPLKDIAGTNTSIDGLWLQGQAEAYKPYYVTKIQFE